MKWRHSLTSLDSMLVACFAIAALATSAAACDASKDADDDARRICQLESEMLTVQKALQELLQRVDITLPEKRKNEFIRFGKRSMDSGEAEVEKRKNEFIRFGKRKNEFIRFGRSDPELLESEIEKRKNEFIRFG